MQFDKAAAKAPFDPLERHKGDAGRSVQDEPIDATTENNSQTIRDSRQLAGNRIPDIYVDPAFNNKDSRGTKSSDIYVKKKILNDRRTSISPVSAAPEGVGTSRQPGAKALNRTADAVDLNNLLDDLYVGDADNSTIHTRVARRDIDQMFCSPDTFSPDRSIRVFENTKFRAASFGELSDIPEVLHNIFCLKRL